jgi:branched-subunit amino acid aminotransferase/4-amino-4-deoxychorismate lyase
MKFMIQTWQVTPAQKIRLDLNASSLDEVTRQLPEGYYSTFRTFDGCTRVLGLTSHVRRLYEPVSRPEVDESFLRRQLRALLEPYRPEEARVRAVMTKEGQVYVAIEPLKPLPREIYEKGVSVVTTELQRQQPRLKSTTFIGRSDSERKYIAAEGVFEALLVKDGRILEGMTSNFFYVVRRNARSVPPYLGTAGDDVLLGITRESVIEVAEHMGLVVKYRPLKHDQLADADEAFITSSSRGIVPITRIDDVTIGQGSPGPITKQLMTAYEAYVIENAEKII